MLTRTSRSLDLVPGRRGRGRGAPRSRLFECNSCHGGCRHSKTYNFYFCRSRPHRSWRRCGSSFAGSSPLSFARTVYKSSACQSDNRSLRRHYYWCASCVTRQCDTSGRRPPPSPSPVGPLSPVGRDPVFSRPRSLSDPGVLEIQSSDWGGPVFPQTPITGGRGGRSSTVFRRRRRGLGVMCLPRPGS